MPKKSVVLDGLVNTEKRPTDTGIPQRGAVPITPDKKPATKKRKGEKRITLALDGEAYRRLRIHAAKNRPDSPIHPGIRTCGIP